MGNAVLDIFAISCDVCEVKRATELRAREIRLRLSMTHPERITVVIT